MPRRGAPGIDPDGRLDRVLAMTRFVLPASMAIVMGAAALSAQAAEVAFDLRVQRGRVPENMRLVRVAQDDIVTLRWSADRPLLLHLHGYDLEWRVQPGTVARVTFTARLTGRFPIHAHGATVREGDGAHEDSPLVYVEVYPR